MSFEETELVDLVRRLRRRFAHALPVGYLPGKTAIRDAVELELGCSELEAEELVDTLEMQRRVSFEGDPARPDDLECAWRIGEADLSAPSA